MLVIYRITSIASSNPSPIYQDDKNRLNELCLKSFISAFWEIKPKIIFLADHCNCEDMIKNVCDVSSFEYEIIKTSHGINEAMNLSYDLAVKEDDYILFQECDYLYKQGVGKDFLMALEELKLLSPYDHPNYYIDRTLHSEECKIKLINGKHYRSAERNTMTWGCHSNMVKENIDMLKSHGYLDGPVWYDLKDRGYELYVPIPSMATHMVRDWMAHGTDWKERWQSIQSS